MTSAEPGAFLSCQGVSKSWKGRPCLQDINLSIEKNERLAIVGTSGAGKTTLLRVIAGLEDAEGVVLLEGRPVPEYSRMDSPVGMVFQRPAVYPHLSVRENLSFPLEQRRKSKAEIAERTRHLAELLHLTGLMDRPASQLSGGEMQRVAIGRALAHPPKILLLDEPFANLHQALRWRMVDYVRGLHDEYSLTTILVTHEPADAMYFANRIAVMGQGRILQLGTVPEVLAAPATLEIAQLLFNPPLNFRKIAPAPVGDEIVAAWTPADTRVNEPEPEDSGQRLLLTGNVRDVGHLYEQMLISVSVNGSIIRAMVSPGSCPAAGTQVRLSVKRSRLHLFDGASGRRVT